MRFTHKLTVGAVSSVAAFTLATGPAFAHYCYNASRSDRGNEAAAKSQALSSIGELLAADGLCPEGVDYVLDGLAGAGFDTHALINVRAVMAAGLEQNHPEKLADGSGIDHFDLNAVFAVLGPLLGQAAEECPPS